MALPTVVAFVVPWLLLSGRGYVAVCTIVLGFAIGYHVTALWVYLVIVALAFELRVITYEEPRLARTFGAEWLAYRGRVPRWFGRSHAVGMMPTGQR